MTLMACSPSSSPSTRTSVERDVSARDDYPNVWGHWREALDEIDRLREDRDLWMRAEQFILNQNAIIAALDDRLRIEREATLRKATADTLRTIAEWGWVGADCDIGRNELRFLAAEVENGEVSNWWVCPVCQENRCDEGCPLEPLR
jgi:hypothetical protein